MSVFAYFKPGENGFYLTDKECKYRDGFHGKFRGKSSFYLTDEECKSTRASKLVVQLLLFLSN